MSNKEVDNGVGMGYEYVNLTTACPAFTDDFSVISDSVDSLKTDQSTRGTYCKGGRSNLL